MNERRRIVDSQKLAGMSDTDYAKAAARGDFDLLKAGIDIRHGDKLTRDDWLTLAENVTGEELAEYAEQGLLAPFLNLPEPSAEEPAAPPAGSADQGGRGGGAVRGQVHRHEVATMSLAEYESARNAGLLDGLLRGEEPR